MIYRKSLLDKLKTLDGLDCMHEINSPMNFLLLIGVGLLAIAIVILLTL